MPFPLTLAPRPGRSCGPCTACCTAVGVEEIAKPPGTPCPSCTGTSCAVYVDRPASCRSYTCLWLAGHIEGDERRRPDNLGLLFEFRMFSLGPVLQVWELRPQVVDAPAIHYLLEKMATKVILYIRRHGDQQRTLLGPAALLQGVEKVVEEDRSFTRQG
jgi:hypothetical protein